MIKTHGLIIDYYGIRVVQWHQVRTGAPWLDVPEKFGNWSASGVWERAAIALAETMAENRHYNIDSTTVRAHVSAEGKQGDSSMSRARVASLND